MQPHMQRLAQPQLAAHGEFKNYEPPLVVDVSLHDISIALLQYIVELDDALMSSITPL